MRDDIPDATAVAADAIRTRAARVSDARARGASPGDEDLRELRRLVQVLPAPAGSRARRSRRLPAVLFALTLALVSLLQFSHVGRTQVTLDLHVSSVRISPAGETPAKVPGDDGLSLDAARVAGPVAALLPAPGAMGDYDVYRASGLTIDAVHDGDSFREGSLTLQPFTVSGNDAVELSFTRAGGTIEIAGEAGATTHRVLTFAPTGRIRLGDDRTRGELVFSADELIHLRSASDPLWMTLTLARAPTRSPFRAMPVDELVLVQSEIVAGASHLTRTWQSSVLSGDLFLEELQGERHALRSGEALEVDSPSGLLTFTELTPQGIRLRFQGTVAGLRVGAAGHELVPSWLAWLQAQQSLGLLWATSLYVFGLVFTLDRWWREG